MSDSPNIDKKSLRLADFSVGDFDRGAPPVVEVLWIFVSLCFFRNPIPLPSQARVFLLRLFGANVGNGVVIRSGVNIKFPWKLRLEDDVWIGEGVEILNLAPVAVCNDCCLSQGAFLCTGSHDFQRSSFDLITSEIAIGPGSWVAARAFVGPGVTIGAGSMIGACALVTKDVPPAHYAHGNPCVVKELLPEKKP